MPKKAKHPGGRPSGYDPKFCDELIEHMETGGSFEAFAGKLRRSKDTLYEWVHKHQEFSDAKKTGTQLALLWFERQAQLGMWIDKEGPVLNTTLWYMNMKNRFGWRDKHEVEQSGSVQKIADPAELKALLDIGAEIKSSRKKK